MDERSQPELVDLIRRAAFAEAMALFNRLVRVAYNQGQIDAYVGVVQRVADVEATAALEPNQLPIEDEIRSLRHQ